MEWQLITLVLVLIFKNFSIADKSGRWPSDGEYIHLRHEK